MDRDGAGCGGRGRVLVGAGVARAQSGPEIMQKHRQVHRVNDEEEQLLRLVSKSGAVKERARASP